MGSDSSKQKTSDADVTTTPSESASAQPTAPAEETSAPTELQSGMGAAMAATAAARLKANVEKKREPGAAVEQPAPEANVEEKREPGAAVEQPVPEAENPKIAETQPAPEAAKTPEEPTADPAKTAEGEAAKPPEEPTAEPAKTAEGEASAEAQPKAKAKREKSRDAKGKGKEGKGKEGKGKDSKGKTSDEGKSGKGKGKGKPTEPYSGPFGGGDGFRLNVKNMSDDVTSERLEELFKPFGKVLVAQVKARDDGKSRGFGFVTLSTEEEGKKAMEEMNGKDIDGKALTVVPAERRAGVEVEGGKLFDKGGKGKGKGKWKGQPDQYAFMREQAAFFQQQQWAAYLQHAHVAHLQQQASAAAAAQMGYFQTPFGMVPYPVAPEPSTGTETGEYEGSLKSLSGRNGYGFIVCAETYKKFQRDVYIDKETLPEGVKVADRIKFTVDLNTKGHPRATTASLVPITVVPAKAD